MRVYEIAKDVTTETSTDVLELPVSGNPTLEGVFQTEFESDTGTANVTLEGRIHPDAPWVTIVNHIATNAGAVVLFPQLRVTTDTVSGSPTINCWIGW